MKLPQIFILGLAVLSLNACVSREQADAKLAEGCKAGISVLLPEDQEINEIVRTEFTPATEGPNHRHVTIITTLENDWLEEEYEYTCVFEESFGLFNANHTGAIVKLDTNDGRVFGKAGAKILGDAQDWIKITNAVRTAMYE